MRSSAVPTVVNTHDPAASPVKVSNRLWYLVSVGLVERVNDCVHSEGHTLPV